MNMPQLYAIPEPLLTVVVPGTYQTEFLISLSKSFLPHDLVSYGDFLKYLKLQAIFKPPS
jgi:hypothetical protein